MGAYHEVRQEIRTLLHLQLELEAEGQPVSPSLDRHITGTVEAKLDRFEDLVLKHRRVSEGYWRGVTQSLWGSAIFAIAVAVAALVIYGSRLNVVDVLTGRVPEKKPADQAPSSK